MSLYEKVKELHAWEDKLGKKTFRMLVRGYTGSSCSTIEKLPPQEIDHLLYMLQNNKELNNEEGKCNL